MHCTTPSWAHMGSGRTHGKQLFAICSPCINRFWLISHLSPLDLNRRSPHCARHHPDAASYQVCLVSVVIPALCPNSVTSRPVHPRTSSLPSICKLGACPEPGHLPLCDPSILKEGSHCRGESGGSRTFCLRMYLKPNVLLALLLLLANAVQASVRVGLDEPRPVQQHFYT